MFVITPVVIMAPIHREQIELRQAIARAIERGFVTATINHDGAAAKMRLTPTQWSRQFQALKHGDRPDHVSLLRLIFLGQVFMRSFIADLGPLYGLTVIETDPTVQVLATLADALGGAARRLSADLSKDAAYSEERAS